MTEPTKPAASPAPSQPDRYHVVGRMPLGYRPWVPVAVAAVLAGLFWLALLIPGVLRYPTAPVAGAVSAASADPKRIAALEEHNRSLREQIERARRLAAADVCVKDGTLFERPPAGRQPGQQGATPGSSPRTAGAEPALKKITPEAGGNVMPSPPERMPVPPSSVPSFEGNIPELLDRSVVMVIGPTGGGRSSMGSGFFIAPNRIVTNRHVVAGGDGQTYFVTNKLLGGVKQAKLIAVSPGGPQGSADFAVLEIDTPSTAPPVMPLTAVVGRLQRVTAAGFPGVVTASDQKLEQLKRGDATAIPDMVLTQGTVTVVQNREAGTPIVGHEATISPGNSGGPLIDDCARVVGVNTYGVYQGTHKVNYALGTESLISFLRSKNIAFRDAQGECQPPPLRTATVPPEQPVGSGPGATPAQSPAAAPTPEVQKQ